MTKVEHFVKETEHQRYFIGRNEYNPVFTKTAQDGKSKYLEYLLFHTRAEISSFRKDGMKIV